MHLVCPCFYSHLDHYSELEKRNMCQKVLKVALATLLIAAVAITVARFTLDTRPFYGCASAISFLSFSWIVFFAIKSYRGWKHKQHARSICGHPGFEKLIPEKSSAIKVETNAHITSNLEVDQLFKILPHDIVFLILSELNFRDLGRLARTCKTFKKVLDQNATWKFLFEKSFSKDETIKDYKREYRLLSAYDEKIFNVYTKLFGYFELTKVIVFNDKLLLLNSGFVNAPNDQVIKIDKGYLPPPIFTTTSFFCVQRIRTWEFFDSSLKHRFTLNSTDLFRGIYETPARLLAICATQVLSFEKENGRLAESIETGTIENFYYLNQKLFLRITDFGVKIYESKPDLKLYKSLLREEWNIGHIFSFEDKIYLHCILNASKGTQLLYDVENFERPMQGLVLERNAFSEWDWGKQQGRYFFINPFQRLMRYDIFTGTCIDYKESDWGKYIPYKNYIFVVRKLDVILVNQLTNEKFVLESFETHIDCLHIGILNDKLILLLREDYNFTKRLLIYDFGKFESL